MYTGTPLPSPVVAALRQGLPPPNRRVSFSSIGAPPPSLPQPPLPPRHFIELDTSAHGAAAEPPALVSTPKLVDDYLESPLSFPSTPRSIPLYDLAGQADPVARAHADRNLIADFADRAESLLHQLSAPGSPAASRYAADANELREWLWQHRPQLFEVLTRCKPEERSKVIEATHLMLSCEAVWYSRGDPCELQIKVRRVKRRAQSRIGDAIAESVH